MTDTVMSPVYLLRSYVWALLRNNTEMKTADYGGLIPIVPVSEEPELMQYNKPFIVYGYALDSSEDVPVCRTGSMTFAIYSTNFREITKIIDILIYAFGRKDESARDVNEYTSTIPEFIGTRFGYISVAFAEGGTPEESSGGRESGMVNISFEYYADYNVVTSVREFTR